MDPQAFDLSVRLGGKELQRFAQWIIDLDRQAPFAISSRGWAYRLEGYNLVTKGQFDKVENAINRCRKKGLIPIDLVAEDGERIFNGVETPSRGSMGSIVEDMLDDVLAGDRYYTPDWWGEVQTLEGDWLPAEEYYIQVIVEKKDLVSLFEPVCREYHIPIANAKGWQSLRQRATYARRFKRAEQMGMKCVLLYGGDMDPAGLLIKDRMRKNIADMRNIIWKSGDTGYDPSNLIIDRFTLTLEQIDRLGLTWIDNLETSRSGRVKHLDLSDPGHKDHHKPYVQNYLKKVGARKCEANAIIDHVDPARVIMRDTIIKYLGPDAQDRFRAKREDIREKYQDYLERHDITDSIDDIKLRLT
jgi:hypothetical protein